MEPIDLEPRFSTNEIQGKCIKCLAEQKLGNYLMELLKGKGRNKKLEQRFETLVSFLRSPESKSLRNESEKHLAEGKEVAVPRIDKALQLMVPVRIRDFDLDLAPGTLGIREPKPGLLNQVAAGDIDVVIAPGAAFDAAGNRIGYGGGYYDRFLKGFQGAAIGLAFDSQLLDRIPRDASRDIPLACIATESRFIGCAGKEL